MNERIRELAKLAGLVRCGDWGMERWEGSRYDSIGDEDLEKFAELIVRECALTLESITVSVLDYNPDFDNGYNKALLTGSAVIKKHFGVQE